MTETASHEAFLQQANRNNWQSYLASLQPLAKPGWSIIVLTASDERQAEMYRQQLAWRREAGLLPAGVRFEVVADPGGRRIGSGGATLRVLAQLPAGQRTLVIHSGGDSKRLPHSSAIGKLFTRLPRALPDGRASTVLDEFLISLSGLANELPAGVLVASGDVLLIFDHLQLAFQRGGVIGVAAAAPAEMGTHHGVYVSEPGRHRLRSYLHKPTLAELARWNAIAADGAVQIDTGLVWLDAPTTRALAGLATLDEVAATSLNLYGDLLLPLAESTTLDGYLADASDGPATPAVQAARRVIWERLRGAPFTVERLQPAAFIHFGTSEEYWRMAAADDDLARTCGWERQAASWSATPSSLALINAVAEGPVAAGAQPALVVDSCLSGALAWRGAALVANARSSQPLDLARDVVLHQLPVRGRFVTRLFGLHDDPKLAWDSPTATFMNRPWAQWLGEADVAAEAIWPHVSSAERTLWNARLYPVLADREASLALTLPLQQPALAPADWWARWQGATRLSLAESFAQADGQGILAELAAIEDEVAARRFHAAILTEQPADEAKTGLGHSAQTIARRSERVGQWLAEADPPLRWRGFQALAVATGDKSLEDRAFAVLAEAIEKAVGHSQSAICNPQSAIPNPPSAVRVEAAARIDFGGGWTDTPPYSLERGGTVLNAAITLRGALPITVEAEWLSDPRLILECRDIDAVLQPKSAEVLDYANPADPFALPKAALVMRGIIPADADPHAPIAEALSGRGLRLSTQTSIPRGSGLGTSSILGGAVLAALGKLLGVELTPEELFDEVLRLEQMLTTGGGWQDQVGGLTGGIKLITTPPGLLQCIQAQPLLPAPSTEDEFAKRLCLVYTGQQRLAKNLLRAVMGRWMARDPEMVWILGEIARLAQQMRAALERGDVDGFGALLTEHWALNKRMHPSCSNPFIDGLFEAMTPHISGGKLAGAGGGGFAIVITREADGGQSLARALRDHYPNTPVTLWPCAIPETAMTIQSLER